MTDLNADVLRGKRLAEVESFTFVLERQQVRGRGVSDQAGRPAPTTAKHPLIVNIHGGPHGQQGPAFNFKNQVYAARGWATLMVNYRGSTGYGQAFADAVFGDQNGNEAQDVLYGVSAAMRRYPWIDRDRLGVEGTSYGGQLSDVADHADQHLQGGDPDRGDHQPDQLQLHDLLQPVRGDGVGRRSRTRAT